MASPLDIQDSAGPQEVFHTPPEESSLPYSDEQRPPLAVYADLCVVNHAVDVDSGTQGSAEFVDFGKDSDLGLSEDDGVDAETIAEFEGDGVPCEDSDLSVDEFRVPKRESSGPGESSVKKLKLSEQDLGFGSSGDLLEAESQKAGVGAGNCDSGANLEHQENVLEPQDLGSGENLENQVGRTEVKENAGAVNTSEAGKLPRSSDEVIEASGTKERIGDEPKGRMLPPSFRVFVDDAAKGLESEEGVRKERAFTFEVLKFLAEQHEKDDDDLENLSWLEVLTRCGVAFPCPRWWPENFVELNYNALGLLLERD